MKRWLGLLTAATPVPLAATVVASISIGGGVAHAAVSASAVPFDPVKVGSSGTRNTTLSNSGNASVTVTDAPPILSGSNKYWEPQEP